MVKQIAVGVDEHKSGRDTTALGEKFVATDGQLTLAFVDAGPYGYRGASAVFEVTERERTLERREVTRAEAGFEVGEVDDWLRAGCFNPDAAEDMDEVGISPPMASIQTGAGTGSYVDTVAYKVAASDLGLQEACKFGVPVARGNGTSGVFVPSRSRRPSVARSTRADGPPVELRQECRYERGC